jgi:hypothetical protein
MGKYDLAANVLKAIIEIRKSVWKLKSEKPAADAHDNYRIYRFLSSQTRVHVRQISRFLTAQISISKQVFRKKQLNLTAFIRFKLRLMQIKTVEIHHFIPRFDEIADEFFSAVVGAVDFGEGAEFGV